MEKGCGERENGNGFQLLGRGRIGGSKQGILEEHDFRPYSPYREKELMMMMMMVMMNINTSEIASCIKLRDDTMSSCVKISFLVTFFSL